MRFLPLLFSLLLLTTADGASITRRFGSHTIHEARHHAPPGWSKRAGLNKRATIPVRINLKQGNLDQAEDLLMAVSHPDSPNYGQHYSAKEVADIFAPSRESINAVKDWLVGAGLLPHRLHYSHPKGALLVNMTIEEVEDLLQTKYDIYEHEFGQPHVACDSYSVPQTIRKHIDFITPTIHFDVKVAKREDDHAFKAFDIGDPGMSVVAPKIEGSRLWDIFTQLEHCDKQTTPACLRALYGFGLYPQLSSHENSLGIVEYTPQAYLPSDLDLFANKFSNKTKGYRPELVSIDGGVVLTNQTGVNNFVESNLDLEYAINLVYPTPVTLYQVGDPVKQASFNNFLGGLDASYCEALDPVQDAVYPNPSCGVAKPTNVISTSYGYNEVDLSPAYEQRQCDEYMKLGMQGVTVIFSSGDYGVAGNGGRCIDPATGNSTTGPTGTKFNPTFPSTCPYVTSVGATQVNNGSSVFQPESACQQHIFSGGGFSNHFGIPSYQEKAVAKYFKKYAPPYTAAQYNNSGTTRGYPDISANGANYVIAVAGRFGLVYGTSASAPVVASILTLINDARLALGKSTIGFINPFLYAHPEIFNDITSGGNQGCGTPGFTAVPGWDPVTGLGTPNFPKMLAEFLLLPSGKNQTLI